ncbi:dihydropyrimidinase [Paeniglutamicibacter kerguelensis]|uniref:Dihydropyrimidinase n=1 Tax=Paeniglutamicibacter kerguelensis TaxID=254788 RepID=A0ABS4XJ72_9MICC|nr:dihydropyrimidinase [Paeniglutamicibacter kerguelensis]MBP2388411.1 dihydropyrimidinase [Paeniglutamicibacter kerguelensis]
MFSRPRRCIVRGGEVVTAAGVVRSDVLVVDGVVAGLGSFEPGHDEVPADAEVIDAHGSYVLPGGVDFHTHLDSVFRGSIRTADDFASGTAAAVAGGTTTIVDFCRAEAGQSLADALADWRERVAAQRPWADYGAHMVLVQPDAETLEQLSGLPDLGVTSVKMYLAYPGQMMSDDEALLRAMQSAAESDMLVLVHAENGHAIKVLVGDALAAGHTEPDWHGKTRPPMTEAEAVMRASVLARLSGTRLYIVHVSSSEALAEIERARAAGTQIFAETCSHYLVFDESMLEGVPREIAARFVCSPPTRSLEDQTELWGALDSGPLDVLSSDHCPFALHGEKIVEGDFTHILNGLPGVEQRMAIAYQGVVDGHYTLARMVEIASSNPAKLAGLYPRKGEIAVGSDADLVILDPRQSSILSASTHHSAADYLPYEGMEVSGRVRQVLLRGETVFFDGAVLQNQRAGAYLHRSTPSHPLGETK